MLKGTSKFAWDASNSGFTLNPAKSLYFYSEALKKLLVDMETFSTLISQKNKYKVTKINQCQHTKR